MFMLLGSSEVDTNKVEEHLVKTEKMLVEMLETTSVFNMRASIKNYIINLV